MFATDDKAISICKHAMHNNFTSQLNVYQRAFIYSPLMKSENKEDQDLSIKVKKKILFLTLSKYDV